LALGLALVSPQPTPQPPERAKPKIVGLAATLEDDRAVVSYRVSGGLSDEAEERIHSGISVALRHRIDVQAKRGIPLMPARTMARTIVETRVEYDSLTRRYDLVRKIEHKLKRKKMGPLGEEQRRITDSVDEMRAWMTELEEIPVFDPAVTLEGNRLRVRVQASLGRKYILWVFPTTHSVSAEVRLEP
jgi:hypothetical protein